MEYAIRPEAIAKVLPSNPYGPSIASESALTN